MSTNRTKLKHTKNNRFKDAAAKPSAKISHGFVKMIKTVGEYDKNPSIIKKIRKEALTAINK